MSGKTEKDILGAMSLLGDLFGVPGVRESLEKAGVPIPKGAGKASPAPANPSDAKTLEPCAKCGVFVLGKDHACSADLGSELPKDPPSHSEIPHPSNANEPHFYCAFDASGRFVGAFVSPYQACDAAGDEGTTKKLPASKIPKE